MPDTDPTAAPRNELRDIIDGAEAVLTDHVGHIIANLRKFYDKYMVEAEPVINDAVEAVDPEAEPIVNDVEAGINSVLDPTLSRDGESSTTTLAPDILAEKPVLADPTPPATPSTPRGTITIPPTPGATGSTLSTPGEGM